MKGLGNLLMIVGLLAAVTGSLTTYWTPLSLSDERLLDLTLNSPAGGKGGKPLAKKGEKLTPDLLEKLREDNVAGVRVKEFDIRRWPYAWLFGVGAVILLTGSLMVRTANRKALEAASRTGAVDGVPPEESLDAALDKLRKLRDALQGLPETARLPLIVARLGELQETHLAAFVGARDLLISRLGMGGYARLMDRFAAGERQVNRAWSAAVDGVEDEARDCIGDAEQLLSEARDRLSG